MEKEDIIKFLTTASNQEVDNYIDFVTDLLTDDQLRKLRGLFSIKLIIAQDNLKDKKVSPVLKKQLIQRQEKQLKETKQQQKEQKEVSKEQEDLDFKYTKEDLDKMFKDLE